MTVISLWCECAKNMNMMNNLQREWWKRSQKKRLVKKIRKFRSYSFACGANDSGVTHIYIFGNKIMCNSLMALYFLVLKLCHFFFFLPLIQWICLVEKCKFPIIFCAISTTFYIINMKLYTIRHYIKTVYILVF